MYSHAPAGYICPFCTVAAGGNNLLPYTQQSDVVYRHESATAFINARWWPNNPGHVLVIPNRHVENIYDLTPDLAVHVHEVARQIALALKAVYRCDGVSPGSTTSRRATRRSGTTTCTSSRAIPMTASTI